MARFDWIPYLQGKYLNYYQWFAVLGSAALLVLSFLSFTAYLLLCKIKIHEQQYKMRILNKKSLIEKLKNITFNGGFVFLSMIPLACSALDVIYWITGIILMSGILIIMVLLDNGRKRWGYQKHLLLNNNNGDDNNTYNKQSSINVYLKLSLKLDTNNKKQIIKMIIISIILVSFMYKTCLCFYNKQIGYYNHLLGFGINTYFTRLFQLERACPPGPPCQIYATIPQNPSEAFFLNIHTHTGVQQVDVYYRELLSDNVTEFKVVRASTFKYQGLEWKTTRNVHSALFIDLKANTKYLTIVSYDGRNYTNGIYKTLPSDPSTPLRMINAGDSGYTQGAVNLSKIVATLNPDIFFMAGDIAYDDNMPACSYTWDSFLGMYGRITASLGYLMPIVVSVGNHDAGLNELPGINITVNNQGPAFLIYFPQHYDRNALYQVIKRVPPIQRRRTVNSFTFSNIHYMVLDSGYMHAFDGWQKLFMINQFENNRDKVKFVNYHVPIYSACQAFDSSPERFLYALFHWVPNFDKFKVMTVYENHVHSFKRTKPLVGSSPTDKGTVYVGDGAYGALIQEMCHPDATLDIFDSFSKSNNFWLSVVYKDKTVHTAYDSHNVIIDHFTQYTADYKLSDSPSTPEIQQQSELPNKKQSHEPITQL